MRRASKMSWIVLLLVLIIGVGAYLYMRPVPSIQPIAEVISPPKTTPISLPWPATGQAALGAVGYGPLVTHNVTSPQPIASIAKVITALAVLQQKPLSPGSQGPTITLDSTDVSYFNKYYSADGSVVNVSAGEQISEYQALQAMLIPSANNMADSLARWAFGSPENYVAYANKMVKGLGLSHTTVGDANGFGDNTLSTADDLVKLGISALQNPSIASVVAQPSAHIPPGVDVKNINYLIGSNGVVGIKTGNTDKAGGCFLFAAKRQVLGKQITMVGAVLGIYDLNGAIAAAPLLLAASDSGFEQIKVVNKDQTLAEYHAPWGASTQLKPGKDLSLTVWKGQDIKIVNSLDSVSAPLAAGSSAGSVQVVSGGQSMSAPLYSTSNLEPPSWHWRLFRK